MLSQCFSHFHIAFTSHPPTTHSSRPPGTASTYELGPLQVAGRCRVNHSASLASTACPSLFLESRWADVWLSMPCWRSGSCSGRGSGEWCEQCCFAGFRVAWCEQCSLAAGALHGHCEGNGCMSEQCVCCWSACRGAALLAPMLSLEKVSRKGLNPYIRCAMQFSHSGRRI